MKLQDFDFRIWNNNSKTYEAGSIIESLGFITSVFNQLTYEKPTIDYEIELWTGYFDKNGKKIYEGDVIKYVYIFKHELLDKGMIKKLPKKVSIGCIGIDNFLGFRILKNKELQCFMKDIANIEIIGNIHENADLLECRE
ncbi:YopX family protein [Campylobacter coli]|uniref:YopX family protein n=1 Tax=Campylobacter coli TaxID=195 RepID=UPI0013901DE5|nr:YopX family protein [Campylobacter coli]